ncbi:uncharacterized protein LOC123606169 [Leopardus geoffroyi]|uniref:uncharacterized protein LOC123606169 n=1 Tax=Leopardus geoffroyi TaxID=46844 RepID=UPI001E2652E1|nr:uncharacterized protein LOC123606169 [Leopardus geoffroyi]XP_045350172.1 uncharacterized protein LOC123606169 [Leopardus geoffroyi]
MVKKSGFQFLGTWVLLPTASRPSPRSEHRSQTTEDTGRTWPSTRPAEAPQGGLHLGLQALGRVPGDKPPPLWFSSFGPTTGQVPWERPVARLFKSSGVPSSGLEAPSLAGPCPSVARDFMGHIPSHTGPLPSSYGHTGSALGHQSACRRLCTRGPGALTEGTLPPQLAGWEGRCPSHQQPGIHRGSRSAHLWPRDRVYKELLERRSVPLHPKTHTVTAAGLQGFQCLLGGSGLWWGGVSLSLETSEDLVYCRLGLGRCDLEIRKDLPEDVRTWRLTSQFPDPWSFLKLIYPGGLVKG